MDKRILLLILALFCVLRLVAQAGTGVYTFLDLPASAQLAAMGGTNVSLANQDVNFAFTNPALLSLDTHNNLGLNYTNYLAGISFGSVIYGFNSNDHNYWALGIRYVNYGQFQETTAENQIIGTFNSVQDYLLNLIYTRQLSEKLNIGVAFQPIYSHYDSYTSAGLSANVGIHFHEESEQVAVGLVARNIGSQIISYDAIDGSQLREPLPLEVELGITKKFEHAPIQLTITATNLQHWNLDYPNGESSVKSNSFSFGNMLFRHLIFAVDLIPNNNFSLSLSYNDRRAEEMAITNIRSLSGFSGGFEVNIAHVRIGFAVDEYQVGILTYHFSLTTRLSDFGIE
jgi:hypothetical protein